LVLGWKEINGIPCFVLFTQTLSRKREIKEYPLTLALSRGGERGERR